MIQLWCIIDKGRWQNAMFKQIRKIALLFSIVGTFCVAICHTSYAQQFDYMSAADFANKRGDSRGKEIAKMFQKKEGKIVCGRSDNICNEGEICIKVRNGDAFSTDTGYCYAPKEGEQIITWSSPIVEMYQATNYEKGAEERFDNREDIPQNSYGSQKYYHRYGDGSLSIKHIEAAKRYGVPLKKIQVCLSASGVKFGCKYVVAAPPSLEISEVSFFETKMVAKRGKMVEGNKNDECFTDTQTGKKICAYITGDTTTLEYAGDSNFNGCEVLPVKVYNMQGCFFCPLARLIFATANNVTSTSFAVFSYGFKVVITVVFAIWLALAALQQVFSFTKQDAPKFLAAIVKQGFKYMVAFFLLASSASLFELFIIPVLDSGLKLGAHIQTVEMKNISKNKNEFKATNDNLVIEESYFNMRPNKGGDNTRTGETLYERIEGFLKSLQSQLAYMQAIGTSLFCVGSHSIITVNIDNLIAGFRMMLLGGIIAAFGFLLTIAFAFYFLDAILQLAIVGAMLPFMIAGWPFKATAQYAGTGFKMLLNTFFVFFFTGFVVSVNIVMVDQALSLSQNMNVIDKKIDEAKEANGNDKKVDEEEIARQEMEKQLREETSNGFEAIASAMNAQNISELREKTDIGGVGFMLLVFSCLFGFKFVQEVPNLANTLSSGGIKGGLAGKIGTMGASTVKGMAIKVSQPIAKEIAGKYHEAGGIAGMALAPVSLVGGLVQSGGEALENKSGNKFLRGVGKVAKWTGKAAKAPRQAAKKVHSPFRKPKL